MSGIERRNENSSKRNLAIGRRTKLANLSARFKEIDNDDNQHDKTEKSVSQSIPSEKQPHGQENANLQFIGPTALAAAATTTAKNMEEKKNKFENLTAGSSSSCETRKRFHSSSECCSSSIKRSCAQLIMEEPMIPFENLKEMWKSQEKGGEEIENKQLIPVSGEMVEEDELTEEDDESMDTEGLIEEVAKAFEGVFDQENVDSRSIRETRSCSPESINILNTKSSLRRSNSFESAKHILAISSLESELVRIRRLINESEIPLRQSVLTFRSILQDDNRHRPTFNVWLEFARTMLFEIHKKQALLEEANRISVRIEQRKIAAVPPALISLRHLSISVDPKYLRNLMSGAEKRRFYFLAFVHCNGQVQQSGLISVKDHIATKHELIDTILTFPGEFVFHDVDYLFELRVYIYSLERSSKRGALKSVIDKLNPSANISSQNNAFHFTQVDCVKLGTENFGDGTASIVGVPSSIPLTGHLFYVPSFVIDDTFEMEGNLALYSQNGWMPMKALLKNNHINLWDDNCEEDAEPNHIINLEFWAFMSIAKTPITFIPISICGRENTFELQRMNFPYLDQNDSEQQILKYWLSADTLSEGKRWCNRINKVLDLISFWSPLYRKQRSPINE